VIGAPHPKWQERPPLIIVRKPDQELKREVMLQFLAGRAAAWWLPDDAAFVEELPHTATGKLHKLKLRERFKDYRLPGAQALAGAGPGDAGSLASTTLDSRRCPCLPFPAAGPPRARPRLTLSGAPQILLRVPSSRSALAKCAGHTNPRRHRHGWRRAVTDNPMRREAAPCPERTAPPDIFNAFSWRA